MSTIVARILAVILAGLLGLAHLHAQATGRLGGMIVDPQDATISGAELLCRNVATGVTHQATSNMQGLFRFPDLLIGTYEVAVSHPGFQKLVRSDIELLTGHTVDVKLRLSLGAVAEVIKVTGDVALVQTTTSEVQTTIDSRAMSELPLNGRNPLELVVLTPGADFTETGTLIDPANPANSQQDNTGVTVNGLRSIDNNYQLDGAGFVNAHSGSAPTLPNPDTLGEFTVQSSNFSARDSRAGAVVQLSTRSGTNRLSGSVFEFVRNDKLDARNFFDADRSPFKRSQYGGSLGGPIVRNRTFFFGSYQGTTRRGSPSPKLLTVPSEAQRRGDFTALASRKIVDPLTKQLFPGNIIPQQRFDPIAVRLTKLIPLPNRPDGTLRAPLDFDQDDHQVTFKVDHQYGASSNVSARYYDDRNILQRDGGSVPGIYSDNKYRNQILTIRDTHVLRPALTATHSFSYARTYRHQVPVSPEFSQTLTDKVPLANKYATPEIRINLANYFNFFSGGPLQFDPTSWEYRGQMAWSRGRHMIGFGADVLLSRESARDNSWGAGHWNFAATQTSNTATVPGSQGDTYASFLLGLANVFHQKASEPARLAENRYQFWFQDDWRIHPRFTLNLGLRWDPAIPPTDNQGPLPGFVPGMQSKVAPDAPRGLVFSGDLRDSIYPADWNNLAPRLGFAWDLTGGGRTVMRAGYGIYYLQPPLQIQRAMSNQASFRTLDIQFNTPASFADPWASYPGGTPFPYTAPKPSELVNYKFSKPVTTASLDAGIRTGYAQSWNLTIERQVRRDTAVSLAYVGNHSLKILAGAQVNPAVYGPGATAGNTDTRRLYVGLASVTLVTPWQWSNYHSGQLTVTKRTSRGFSLLANYVFSKAIDNGTDGTFGNLTGEAFNPFDWNSNKGLAQFDSRHRVNAALLYDLPQVVRGRNLAAALVNGWQLNAIVRIQSGSPFTVLSGLNRSLAGVSKDHADIVGDPKRPAGVDPVVQWFNTAAFVPNAPGTFGTSGRDILSGPGKFTVNFSTFKNFRATERFKVQFRFEAFNFFNRANFRNPIANTNSVNNGQLLGAADPRVIQLGLKLLF